MSLDAMEASEGEDDQIALPREAWVAWYFAAMMARRPLSWEILRRTGTMR